MKFQEHRSLIKRPQGIQILWMYKNPSNEKGVGCVKEHTGPDYRTAQLGGGLGHITAGAPKSN